MIHRYAYIYSIFTVYVSWGREIRETFLRYSMLVVTSRQIISPLDQGGIVGYLHQIAITSVVQYLLVISNGEVGAGDKDCSSKWLLH